jgi:uncharacterized tellurite resistance protein B-like protein
MDITDFTTEQRKALLDLVVLTMYMDGFLASFEAARIQQILTAMGLDSPYDRDREFDASVTRVRPHSENLEAARTCATRLAKLFTTSEQQRRVYDLLCEITESDGDVSPAESKFLSSLKNTFRL